MANGKGWYRYRLLFGATLKGESYDLEMVLQKKGKTELVDFTEEEAKTILKQIGAFMEKKADYKNLREDY